MEEQQTTRVDRNTFVIDRLKRRIVELEELNAELEFVKLALEQKLQKHGIDINEQED